MGDGSAGYYAEPPAPRRKSMSLAQGPDLNRLSLALKLSARSSLATSMAGLGSWSGRKSDGLNWRPKHSSGRRWHRVGCRPADGLFLVVSLVILPYCVTDKKALYCCARSRRAPSSSRGWSLRRANCRCFLMPRCDVKHTTTRAVRSVVRKHSRGPRFSALHRNCAAVCSPSQRLPPCSFNS